MPPAASLKTPAPLAALSLVWQSGRGWGPGNAESGLHVAVDSNRESQEQKAENSASNVPPAVDLDPAALFRGTKASVISILCVNSAPLF